MGSAGGPFVRREIWSLPADDPIVVAYGRAVVEMRSRPADDPTSWSYQAAIHGTYASPQHAGWNECQHGTWFFLPWHRMFLYFFERIVRAAVVATGGPADWALPYWNYGLGGSRATLPLAFREASSGDGSANPLYVAERAPGINAGGALPGRATSPAKALGRPDFIGIAEFGGGMTAPAQFSESGGEVEETPHNVVHSLVGGRGLMGDIRKAALDPIFWLHHANIDRLWSVWNVAPNRSNPSQAQWTGQSFEFFDEQGARQSMQCGDVLETLPMLSYTYDTDQPPAAPGPPPPPPPPPQAAPVPQREQIGASEQGVQLIGAPASVSVLIESPAAREPLAPGQHVYLNVESIEGENNPGTVYGVYADLPEVAPADLEGVHHVGNVSFFGIERAQRPPGDEPAHTLRTSLELTPYARELQARGEWAGHTLVITFRPLTLQPPEQPDPAHPVHTPAHEDRPIQVGRVSVFYDA